MTHPAAPDCEVHACPLDRRAVLLAAGLAVTVSVAGCGADEPTPAAASTPVAPSEATPSEPSTSAGGAQAIPAGALTLVAHVPVGGGVVVEEGKVLVVQPNGGTFKAYDAKCPHRGVPVNPPDADGIVVCPRHRARFKAADGSVVKGPAERALSGIPVKVDGEYVVRA
jgi:nitrite reductase/ring-hydroxylating ferredoxin subunit